MPAEQNADVAKRLYAALACGDTSALKDVLHPSFVGSVTPTMPAELGGEYDSPESMQTDFWWKLGRTWTAEARPESFHQLDDGRLMVQGLYIGAARPTGRKLDARFIHLLTFDELRIVRLEQLTDSAAWAETLEGATPTIDYEVDAGLALVTLARPHARNAIDLQMAEDTLRVARKIEADSTIRAVLIRGKGDDFTVGGDISYFVKAGTDDLGALLRTMTTPFHEAFRILSTIDAPIVTATRGAVAGGGIGFVFASDISIASSTSRFVTAFAGLGISGDGGWSWHLPRRVGPVRAAELVLTNRPVDAEEAAAIGLVTSVVPDQDLDAKSLELARQLADGPTRGYAGMRRLMRETSDRSLADQLRAETDALVESGRTADAREAIDAFLQKRKPSFGGS
jgi:2-(1,2-epoxy-1,2-dihydrophenyl)acetyl-CoA isomerase